MNNPTSISFLYLIAFFAIMYFLIIRPQQRQQKRRQEMLSKIRVNDPVVIAGGIHGRVTKIKEDLLTVRIADKVEIEVDRTGVSYVPSQEG